MLPDVQKAKYPEGIHHEQVFSKGTVSAMLVPLYQNNRLLGYLGFSSSKKISKFPQKLTSAFKITAEIIINLFEKKFSIDLIDLNKKIVSKTSGMMAYTDPDGKVIMHNEAFAAFHSEKTLLKENKPEFLHLYTDSISSGRENFITAFEMCKKGVESKTEIWINKNNSLRLLEVFFHPILQSRENITGIIFNSNDITERVQLEARILEVIHTERKKIGISLHDDLGHDLLAVAIKSRLIYDKLKTIYPELSEEVKEIETSIKYAIDEVRRLSRGLIPYKNSGLDFREMLDAIALTIERDYNLECSFTIDQSISINDESIIKEIFYIIDEAVMNSLKHSSCSRITIKMRRENNMIMLKIIDNGKGIDNNKSHFEGVGLEIMNYRARTLGGGLEISRNPEGGTIIKCIFSPVKIQA
jgi:PAS domain S-box-containing protein